VDCHLMVRVPLWPTVPHHYYSLKMILLQHIHGHGLNLLACVYTEADVRVTSIIFYNVKSRRMRWAGHVARMGEMRNAHRILVGKPEGKRPLGRPRRSWSVETKRGLTMWVGITDQCYGG
jgi:hypothetical protein